MIPMQSTVRALCFGVLLFLSVSIEPAHGESLLTGVNVPNATRAKTRSMVPT
jgi:hypothetical protein